MPTSAVDLDAERADLLAIHANVRSAHFETDPVGVLAYDADEWINVRDGKVTVRHRAEDLKMFADYLAGAIYHEWDDIEPPIIRVSDDATVAWMITHVRVSFTQTDENVRFDYAGMETYGKRGGRWIKVAEAGTFEIK